MFLVVEGRGDSFRLDTVGGLGCLFLSIDGTRGIFWLNGSLLAASALGASTMISEATTYNHVLLSLFSNRLAAARRILTRAERVDQNRLRACNLNSIASNLSFAPGGTDV